MVKSFLALYVPEGLLSCFSSNKSPLYPLNKKLGERHSRSGRSAERKNLLPIPRIKPRSLGCSASSLVTVPTALYRLLISINWKIV
jgi:hypothetical protein